MPEHTPGPTCRICSRSGPYLCMACECYFCRQHMADHALGTQERELLLSRDELLAALEGCLGYFAWMAAQQTEHLTSGAAYAPDAGWLQPIEAAIAKAKGGEHAGPEAHT